MWRKGKTSLDVGGEENTLTLACLGLGFPLRQSPGPVSNQAVMGDILQVLLHDTGADPVPLDPTRRLTGPRRRTPSHLLAFAIAFFARSKAAVFSFTIVAGEAREEQRGGGGGKRSERARGRGRGD